MEKLNDKSLLTKPEPGDSEQWEAYDGYDCKPPKVPFTKEYSESLWPPGVKEAIAKREAELKAARTAADSEAAPKKP